MEGINYHRITSNLAFNYGDTVSAYKGEGPDMLELQDQVEDYLVNGNEEAFDKIIKLLNFNTESRYQEIKDWLKEENEDPKNLAPTEGDYNDEEETLDESVKLLSPSEFKALNEKKKI